MYVKYKYDMEEPEPQVQDVPTPSPLLPPTDPATLQDPDEDAETHLFCTNDWMNAHHFWQRCRSPRILFNAVRSSMIVVSIIRTYKCRLAN